MYTYSALILDGTDTGSCRIIQLQESRLNNINKECSENDWKMKVNITESGACRPRGISICLLMERIWGWGILTPKSRFFSSRLF